jgi:hypothetical protein
MTTEQRTARAILKASQQRARVRPIQGRPGFFLVRSASDPKEHYVVAAHGGQVECSCKAAEYGNPCWHKVKTENYLIRQQGAVPQQLRGVA